MSFLKIFITALAGLPLLVQSQSTIDSLNQVLETAISEKEKVDIYVSLSVKTMGSDLSASSDYARKATLLAEKTSYFEGKIDAQILIGGIHTIRGNYQEAGKIFQESIVLSENHKYQEGKLNAYLDLGNLRFYQGRYQEALDVYFNFLEIANDKENKYDIALGLMNIGAVYSNIEEYDKALDYFFQSLEISKEIEVEYRIATLYMNIGSAMSYKGEYSESLKYLFDALTISEKLKEQLDVALCLENIGQSYLFLEDYGNAIKYASRSVDEYRSISGLLPQISHSLSILGNAFYEQDEYSKSRSYFQEALVISTDAGLSEAKLKASEGLSKVEAALGNHKAAYENQLLFKELSDSVRSIENLTTISRMESTYRFEQEKDSIQFENGKEKFLLNDSIDQQRTLKYMAAGGIIVLVFIIYILYRYDRSKQKANVILKGQRDEIALQKKELEELDTFKSNFFANISHELRTPLTLISAPTKEILSKGLDTPRAYENLKLINKNTSVLQVLVDDILDLSKLESRKMKLKISEVNIHSFLNRVWSNFESLSVQLKINYKIDVLSLPQITLKFDARKVEKVINNLLSNALKQSLSGDEVILTASVVDERLHVRVTDTGAGINEADLPYIFNRYFQSKQPNAPLQGGTGIGLALAKEYTLLMEGNLTVESSLGEGSMFTLDFPYEAVANPVVFESEPDLVLEEENPYKDSKSETEAIPGQKRKILIVEDNEDMQQFIKSLLEEQYQVNTALNGKQALDALEKGSYDLIISDVMMPEMDGFTLLTKLRENELYQSLPVIMLTALSDEDHKLKALNIGVDDYLAKPFSPAELLARITNMLTRQQVKLQTQTTVEDLDHQVSGNVRTKDDLELITEVEKIIVTEMENEEFKLEDMAEHFHLSTRQLHRRIKQITGLSPKEYQREVALQKARRLLEDETYNNLSAVAYSVGIRNTTRFAQYYENRFGKDPREYFKLRI